MTNILEIKLETNTELSNLKEKFLSDAIDIMYLVNKSNDIVEEDKIYIIDSLFKLCREIDIDFNDYTELKKLQVFIQSIEPFEKHISVFKKIYKIFKRTLKVTFNTIILLAVSAMSMVLSYYISENILQVYNRYTYLGFEYLKDTLNVFIFFSYLALSNIKFWYDIMNYIIRNSLFNDLNSLHKELCSLFNIKNKNKIKIPKDADLWFNNIKANTYNTINKINDEIFKEQNKSLIKKSKRRTRKCRDNQIMNPKTNRCVKKNGKVGKTLS